MAGGAGHIGAPDTAGGAALLAGLRHPRAGLRPAAARQRASPGAPRTSHTERRRG